MCEPGHISVSILSIRKWKKFHSLSAYAFVYAYAYVTPAHIFFLFYHMFILVLMLMSKCEPVLRKVS